MKSMVQLLAPLAVTIAFYIVWCIFFAILALFFDANLKNIPYNIFDFERQTGFITVFWIINVVLIIIAEIYVTSISDKDFE